MVFSSSSFSSSSATTSAGPLVMVGPMDFMAYPYDHASTSMQAMDPYPTASFHGLSLHEVSEVNKLLAMPVDGSGGWGLLEDLDHVMWIRHTEPAAPPAYAARPREPAIPHPHPRARARRTQCPHEVERRRAHRRSLQKGYEKEYRHRKRQTREQLRQEWLCLESELKVALVAAQNVAIVVRDEVALSHCTLVARLEDLCGEQVALRTENFVLQCLLCSEERHADALAYFAQSSVREKLNAISGQPSVLQFQFSW